VSLDGVYNARRADLPDVLRTPTRLADAYGIEAIRGMPFAFGGPDGPDVLLLDGHEISIELGSGRATYVLFLHAVEDVATNYLDGLADSQIDGCELGDLVSEYELEYGDGSVAQVPVLRRFAIQQARYEWGSAPFACVPAAEDEVFPSADEMQLLARVAVEPGQLGSAAELGLSAREHVALAYGVRQQTRTASALELGGQDFDPVGAGRLWVYALPNAEPDRPLRRVTLRPRGARSVVYAVTLTELAEHPLRRGMRRKLRLRLPDGVHLNAAGEMDEIDIDLGTVISARPALEYDPSRWAGEESVVEPSRSSREVIVEYTAHPQARLYVGDCVYELGEESEGVAFVAPAHRPVRLRFLDRESLGGVAVRLHLHGEAGEYLPPRGHHRKVNSIWWGQDSAAEFVNIENQYVYVDGECIVDLPFGTVFLEVTRGYEIAPLRTSVQVGPDTDELVFELEKVLRWRERGWVTADTHVHFLSPQTALLEGRAEGVNVVNLLASQWGEMFSNVGDFDGRTTIGADDLDGGGEFLVRVGSENRMNVLGHISLLGYSGELIHPLCTGGPGESAVGDPLEVTMAEWAQRCIDQRGLVVMPHAPTPQLERAADIVLGLVGAIELMTFNPLHPTYGQLNAYGIADWYRYLNLGYHVPLVAGSDKMSAGMLLGGIRTYAQLGDHELNYDHWMQAIRAGNTFATVGPLATMRVEGVEPGGQLRLPATGAIVQVEWEVESVRMPIDRVEVIIGGLVADDTTVGGELSARGCAAVPVSRSSWIALRIRGSYRGNPDDIAAHTSAVQVLVEGSELFSEHDSMTVLDQIQGAIAYVDTIATRPDARRYRALRATLETAYNRLHQRMHAAGVYHRHPLHDPAEPHEH
jgi:hypothetical protein